MPKFNAISHEQYIKQLIVNRRISIIYYTSYIRIKISSVLIEKTKHCGVFKPCKKCNLETRSCDYATVDEAVFSPCRAELCRVVSSLASSRHASLVARQEL
jgi:hypothetical protein